LPERLRIVVLGYVVRGPLAGYAWHHIQYVLGLRDLGHDVYFIEDSDDYPSCYDPIRNVTDADATYGLEFAHRTFTALGLADRWAYYDRHTSGWHGPCAERAIEICRSASLLLNVSGMNPLRRWLIEIPTRVFIDTDPTLTQIRHLENPEARERASGHTAFFSFAGNLGMPGVNVPNDGFPWRSTRQPIVIDAWPTTPGPRDGKFTTVMQWESIPAATYDGVRFGMKSDSFGPYSDLPTMTSEVFELAIGSRTAPRSLLRRKGWRLRDSRWPTRDIGTYQRYIQRSKGEIGIAKHAYVVSRSGWFSERSACYLASARPVVAQDTGFATWLPEGEGVIAFGSPEEAVAGITEVDARYEAHCEAARELVREYFDSRKVLSRLLEVAQ
jgi:hypothetical protein